MKKSCLFALSLFLALQLNTGMAKLAFCPFDGYSLHRAVENIFGPSFTINYLEKLQIMDAAKGDVECGYEVSFRSIKDGRIHHSSFHYDTELWKPANRISFSKRENWSHGKCADPNAAEVGLVVSALACAVDVRS